LNLEIEELQSSKAEENVLLFRKQQRLLPDQREQQQLVAAGNFQNLSSVLAMAFQEPEIRVLKYYETIKCIISLS